MIDYTFETRQLRFLTTPDTAGASPVLLLIASVHRLAAHGGCSAPPSRAGRRLGAVCLQVPLLICCPDSPRIGAGIGGSWRQPLLRPARGLRCRWPSETVRRRTVPDDGHYGMWSACGEVFDDHLPGPGVLQHPRRQLVNGMGRGPHRPGDASTPADPVTRKGALRVLGCDHKCVGESPPRSGACACVLPAKLGDEGPKL
jgi:hypothetical protein